MQSENLATYDFFTNSNNFPRLLKYLLSINAFV